MDSALWNLWSNSMFTGYGFSIVEAGVVEVNSTLFSMQGLQLPSNSDYSLGIRIVYPIENSILFDSTMVMNWRLRQYYDSLQVYGSEEFVQALVHDIPFLQIIGDFQLDPEDDTTLNPINLEFVKEDFTVYPNPFGSSLILEYEILVAGEIGIELYDLQGKLVKEILCPTLHNPGMHQVVFNEDIFESGMYLVVLNSGNQRLTRKVVSMK